MKLIKYFKSHRIQNGKAIISLVLRTEKPEHENGAFLEWVGDAYELRVELDKIIENMEKKTENISP